MSTPFYVTSRVYPIIANGTNWFWVPKANPQGPNGNWVPNI